MCEGSVYSFSGILYSILCIFRKVLNILFSIPEKFNIFYFPEKLQQEKVVFSCIFFFCIFFPESLNKYKNTHLNIRKNTQVNLQNTICIHKHYYKCSCLPLPTSAHHSLQYTHIFSRKYIKKNFLSSFSLLLPFLLYPFFSSSLSPNYSPTTKNSLYSFQIFF